MDRSSTEKIKETLDLNDTLGQMNLTDDKAFHLKPAEYILFSNTYGIFFKIDHILGHRISLDKCKNTEIMQRIFSSNNEMQIEINPGTPKNLQMCGN